MFREYHPAGYGTTECVSAVDEQNSLLTVHVWRAACCD